MYANVCMYINTCMIAYFPLPLGCIDLMRSAFFPPQHAFNFMDRGVVFRLVAHYMEAFSYKETVVHTRITFTLAFSCTYIIIYICACYILGMKESIEWFFACVSIYMYIYTCTIYMYMYTYMYVFPTGSL